MDSFATLTGLKTLLIDDNEIIRDVLASVFSYKNCLIQTFETAEEALDALESERFDIILCDFRLPGMNGVEFFKRAAAGNAPAVRVLISGDIGEYTVAEALALGIIDVFLRKPFSISTLLEELAPLVRRYRAAEGSPSKKKTGFEIRELTGPVV